MRKSYLELSELLSEVICEISQESVIELFDINVYDIAIDLIQNGDMPHSELQKTYNKARKLKSLNK